MPPNGTDLGINEGIFGVLSRRGQQRLVAVYEVVMMSEGRGAAFHSREKTTRKAKAEAKDRAWGSVNRGLIKTLGGCALCDCTNIALNLREWFQEIEDY